MGEPTLEVGPAVPPAPDPGGAAGGAGSKRLSAKLQAARSANKKGRRAERVQSTGEPGPASGFSIDGTRALVRLPFNMAYVGTGYDGWLLEQREEDQLAASGAVALNEFVRVDPKWASLFVFSMALLSVTSTKAVKYSQAVQAAAAEKAKRDKENRDREAKHEPPVYPDEPAAAEASGAGEVRDGKKIQGPPPWKA